MVTVIFLASTQAPLLERLCEEASNLHGRTADSSLEPAALEHLQQDYQDARDAAEVSRGYQQS